jgi:hypothetical protein
VPQHVKDIIAATDDELKQRRLSTMGWDDVRETVFSELAFRGTSMLKLEGIGRGDEHYQFAGSIGSNSFQHRIGLESLQRLA